MLKSSRGNRLAATWQCPKCRTEITAQHFRLAPGDASSLLCPNQACGQQFAWKQQNKGKLWPEQRAYNVLR